MKVRGARAKPAIDGRRLHRYSSPPRAARLPAKDSCAKCDRLTPTRVARDRRCDRRWSSWSPACCRRSAASTRSKDVAKIDGRRPISKDDVQPLVSWSSRSSRSRARRSRSRRPPLDSKQGEALKQQVMQFLVSADWIEGEAKERGVSASAEEVKRQFEQTKDQSFPNDKAYKQFLATSARRAGHALPGEARRAREQGPRERHRRAPTDVSQSAGRGLLQGERAAVLAARAPRPRGRHRQEPGQGQRGPEARRGRREVEQGRQGPLDRPRLQAPGRPAARRRQGPAGDRFDAAHLLGREGQVAGPVKTDAGYYVFRVTKITPATQAEPQPVQAGHPAAADLAEPAEEARRFSTGFRNEWRAKTDCAQDYVIPDCRNGREAPQTTPPPTAPAEAAGQGRQRRGAAGARRHGRAARGGQPGGGDTVIGRRAPQGAAAGGARRPPPAAARRRQARARARRRAAEGRQAGPRRASARAIAQGGGAPAPQGGAPQGGAAPGGGAPCGRPMRRAAGRGAARARRGHAAAAPRLPLGPRAGRAQHRPAHGRGGLRARRRRALRRRRASCSTSSATCCSRSTSWRCCSRSAARATSQRSRAGRPRSWSAAIRTSSARTRTTLAALADRGPRPPPRCAQNWDAIKRTRARGGDPLGELPENLPALLYARSSSGGAAASADAQAALGRARPRVTRGCARASRAAP